MIPINFLRKALPGGLAFLAAGCQDALSPLGAQQPGEQLIATPTPAPTATPSPLDVQVSQVARQIGAAELRLLGLSGEDLINLAISLLIIALGGLLGAILARALVASARRTRSELDDQMARVIAAPLRYMVLLLALEAATRRLSFLPPDWKQTLGLLYFSLAVITLTQLVWRLLDDSLERALSQIEMPKSERLQRTLAPLLRRSLQTLVYLIGLGIILQSFGVNLSALFALLGIGGLAVSLAVRETLADMISGFMILLDRPFRVGDRVKAGDMDTWGDVEDIGARTTRIRTPDNRLVVIPNSVISRQTIVNYSYPDPSFMLSLEVGIAHGSDIRKAIEAVAQAIEAVPGLHPTRKAAVDLNRYGENGLVLSASYWLESYKDIGLRGQVNQAVLQGLLDNHIALANPIIDVNISSRDAPGAAAVQEGAGAPQTGQG